MPLNFRNLCTSSAVDVPCNFCPDNNSSSNSSNDFPVLTYASATFLFRPPEPDRIRSKELSAFCAMRVSLEMSAKPNS